MFNYGDKERWFDVDEDNIRRIRDKGYIGKDGLQVGYKAAYMYGPEEGYEVISKEEFEEVYGKDDPEDDSLDDRDDI